MKDDSKLNKADISNFVMTDKGLKFFFNAGEVADKKDGVQSVEISYDDLKDFVRKDIGSRVIDPSKPMVALTYDDGPEDRTTEELLDLFEKEGVVCTFYELGKNVQEVQRLLAGYKRLEKLRNSGFFIHSFIPHFIAHIYYIISG